LVFRKIFLFYFEWKTLSINYEKLKNILLFVNYIKFGHKIVIYFILNFIFIYFQYEPLEFYLILFLYQLWFLFFWLLFFSLILFLIEIFLPIKFDLHSFDCNFLKIIYEIKILFLISSSFKLFIYQIWFSFF